LCGSARRDRGDLTYVCEPQALGRAKLPLSRTSARPLDPSVRQDPHASGGLHGSAGASPSQRGSRAARQEPRPHKGAGRAARQEPRPHKGAGCTARQEPRPHKGASRTARQEPRPHKGAVARLGRSLALPKGRVARLGRSLALPRGRARRTARQEIRPPEVRRSATDRQNLPVLPRQRHFPQTPQSSRRDFPVNPLPELSDKPDLSLSSGNLMKTCRLYGCVVHGWIVDSWSEAVAKCRIQSSD